MTQEQEQRIAAIINARGFDLSREIVDLPYFVGAKEWKERHGDVVPQFDSETCPATTGAGYCTCKIEQPLLDHLPEGSY